jgi:formate C-acetyltransferase
VTVYEFDLNGNRLANLTDAMIAVGELVYKRRELTLAEFYRICKSDFADAESLRQRIVNRLPKYGNDDADSDALAAQWARFLMDTTEARTAGVHRLVPGFFCWVMHGRPEAETIATPDGRRAATPPADGAGRRGVRHVIETYLRRGGFEVQVNVVGAETLRAAQADPQSHRDLIVRVAGYSDYFTNLTANLQDEVIRRTEFAGI